MIKNFTTYISESEKSIDYLETLTPDQLGELLIDEVKKKSPDFQYIRDILDVGCPIDARDNDGMGALNWATFKEHNELIEFLISRGFDINVQPNGSWTPLHFTAWHDRRSTAKLLVSKGADIHIKDHSGRTAWDLANNVLKASVPELNPNR